MMLLGEILAVATIVLVLSWPLLVRAEKWWRRAKGSPLVTPEEHANTCEKLRAAQAAQRDFAAYQAARDRGDEAEAAYLDEAWQANSLLARLDRDGLPKR